MWQDFLFEDKIQNQRCSLHFAFLQCENLWENFCSSSFAGLSKKTRLVLQRKKKSDCHFLQKKKMLFFIHWVLSSLSANARKQFIRRFIAKTEKTESQFLNPQAYLSQNFFHLHLFWCGSFLLSIAGQGLVPEQEDEVQENEAGGGGVRGGRQQRWDEFPFCNGKGMITLYHGLQFVRGISHTVLEGL